MSFPARGGFGHLKPTDLTSESLMTEGAKVIDAAAACSHAPLTSRFTEYLQASSLELHVNCKSLMVLNNLLDKADFSRPILS